MNLGFRATNRGSVMWANLCTMVTALVSICAVHVSASTYKTFRSPEGRFSVVYPTDWHLLKGAGSTFEVINFAESKMLKGVGLSEHGASIVLVPGPSDVKTIQEWITRDSLRSKSVRKLLEVTQVSQVPGGCAQLKEVEWDEDVGPGTSTHQTAFYCGTNKRLYRIVLWHWKGDPNQESLRRVALKIALSLRSW